MNDGMCPNILYNAFINRLQTLHADSIAIVKYTERIHTYIHILYYDNLF